MVAAPFLANLDLSYNQLQRGRLHNLASDPTGLSSTQQGHVFFRTDSLVAKLWNGTAADQVTGGVVSVLGTTGSGTVQGVTAASAVAGSGRTDTVITLSTTAASGSAAGSMSAADFSKLGSATASNTVNTIVMRDGSGNFTAGIITGSLTGTASNASSLNSQAASFYLDRANHTGSQLASTVSNFDTQVRTSRLDQMSAPTAAVALNGQRLTGLADPTAAQDAATKAYADSVATGLDVKASVRAASVNGTPLTLSGTQTVDGVALVAGDRVLVKNQNGLVANAANGIYVVAAGAWSRAADADTSAKVTPGLFTFTEEGGQQDTGWVLNTNAPIVLGTTALAFTQFSGAGSYAASNGVALNGTTFSAVGTAARISVSSGGIDIDSGYLGQPSITTLGVVATGTWNATTIAITKGGTGATDAATALSNLGGTRKTVVTFAANGALTTWSVPHTLGVDHAISIYDPAGVLSYFGVTRGATSDTVDAGAAPATGTYTAVLVG